MDELQKEEGVSADRAKKVVRGRGFIVDNQNRKFGQDLQYVGVWIQLPDKNKDYALLFTNEEIARAKERGKDNLEDVPAIGNVAVLGKFDEDEDTDINQSEENEPRGDANPSEL
jgi:hypothetical protein